jgi:hypothetical protein
LDTVPLEALWESHDVVWASCCWQSKLYLTWEQYFTPTIVKDNPQAFVGTSWVYIEHLWDFMSGHDFFQRSMPFIIQLSLLLM